MNPTPAGSRETISRPRASIVIPVKDDPRVGEVVAALRNAIPQGVEILVADDGGGGGAVGQPSALEHARVVPVHGENAAAARNAAARVARGDVLLFTDADVVLPPGWVDAALRNFDDPAVEAVAGDTRAAGRGPLAGHADRAYERFVRSHASTRHADLCDTRCFGIRRELFLRFAFDSEEPFCEDASLGRRLFEAGVRIRFDPEWFVWHRLRPSWKGEIDRWRRYAAGSELHLRRTGRDLFRSPGEPPPRGPGARLLSWTRRAPSLAPPAGGAARMAAALLVPFARLPFGVGAKCFDAARRLAVLSARVHPGRGAIR